MYRLLLATVLLFGFAAASATLKRECGDHDDIEFCFYPGDPSSTRLVIFFHGYGDNVRSWDDHPPTVRVEEYWKKNNVARPNVVNISRGKWWYVDAERGTELNNFLAWFEAGHFSYVPQRVLYGESMGGHNAYRWAIDNPGLFDKMVLACPAFPKFFVKDAPLNPGSGLFEWFAEQMIGGAYRDSSLPDFNPLMHPVSEKAENKITQVHIVATDQDAFGFYDGDLALHRLLSKDPLMSVSLEVQHVTHCDHEATALAKFLAE